MAAIRWIGSIAIAVLITTGLLYIMQSLIATGEQVQQGVTVVKMVDATMPDIEIEVVRQIERPEAVETLDTPPPPTPDRNFDDAVSTAPVMNVARAEVDLDLGLDIGAAGISVSDGEYLPLVNVTPQYPTRAASRGIEGWCQVAFTVTETGGVRDVVVVDAEPQGIFDSSSIRAAERFKFQPRVVDGKAVEVPNVQYVFRYQLEGEQ